jgi:hypothetical protein
MSPPWGFTLHIYAFKQKIRLHRRRANQQRPDVSRVPPAYYSSANTNVHRRSLFCTHLADFQMRASTPRTIYLSLSLSLSLYSNVIFFFLQATDL